MRQIKHKDIIDRMTPEEKAAFLSGRNEWETWGFARAGVPSIFMSDGPSGVRKQAGEGDHLGINPSVPATCFPSSAAVANSWDPELAEAVGEGLGAEAAAEDVNVLLGPGVNIKRNPLCGRNFEYFSEDPYLAGKMAAAEVRGIQKNGSSACLKHFAVNSQETRRMAMNAVLDERTLREIYLTAFEIAVKEGRPHFVMSSYNMVNGTYANENKHLLKDILRDDWGFDGAVVTDWGGSNDHALGVKNGSNLEMPNPGLSSARELLQAVKDGKIAQSDIDERVDELLDVVLLLHKQHEEYKNGIGKGLDKEALHKSNHKVAQRAAEESAVLLKNEEGILPLKAECKVAIIGDFAFTPRYQGAGSSMVNSTEVETIAQLAPKSGLNIVGMAQGYQRDGSEAPAKISEATALAEKADVVILFFGLNEQSESEGLDRTHLRIPQNQINLMQELARVNANLVGVISAGSVIEMPWHHHFKALLHTYLSGQAGASAALRLLSGAVNPSGRLNETILKKYEDTPSYQYYPAQQRNSEYRESIFVGYRYFQTAGVEVVYPFGYGLSYTTFGYSDLKVTKEGVRVTVENTGERDGAEVVQMYVGLKDSRIFRATKELKGFRKVFLKAGEKAEVVIPFDGMTFRYWNRETDRWETEAGTYQIYVGGNARDAALTGEIAVEGTTVAAPYEKEKMPSYYSGKVAQVPDGEFRELLGGDIPDGTWKRGDLGVDDALCQMYYAKSAAARKICSTLRGKIEKAQAAGETPDLNTLFQYNMPFRAIAKMTGGMVSMEMVRGIVRIVNGHFFSGLGGVIGGFFRNMRRNKAYLKLLEQQNKM